MSKIDSVWESYCKDWDKIVEAQKVIGIPETWRKLAAANTPVVHAIHGNSFSAEIRGRLEIRRSKHDSRKLIIETETVKVIIEDQVLDVYHAVQAGGE